MRQSLRKLGVILIAIIIALLSLSTVTSTDAELESRNISDEVSISSMDSEAIDENNDGIYENLVLTVNLAINTTDWYFIEGSMEPSGIPLVEYEKGTLDVGEHEIKFSFDGETIYKNSKNGPYSINIVIINSADLVIKETHKTNTYQYKDFKPKTTQELTGFEEITVRNNRIELRTKMFVAIIYELTPMIEFHYTSDDGQTTKFRIKYEDIICFNDANFDGVYQDSELKYWGDLINSQWSSPKTLMEGFDKFDFQVETVVGLMNKNNELLDTRLELVFHYSSLTQSDNIEVSRKFDINMMIVGPPLQDVSYIALKHSLEDEKANHDFIPGDDKISFFTADNKEHGYYGWKDKVEVTSTTDGKFSEPVSYNMEEGSKSSERKLYLYYPYSKDINEFYHDPVVGVNPENIPELPTEPEPETITHGQWLFLYIIVALIAAAGMIGNIYRQKKKRRSN